MHDHKPLHSRPRARPSRRSQPRREPAGAQYRLWAAWLAIFLVGPPTATAAELARQAEPPPDTHQKQLIIKGRVQHVHAPRLFTLEDRSSADRELLVIVPRAKKTPSAGATIVVGGVLRRFDRAELYDVDGWNDIDEPTRKGFDGRPVLIATSLVAGTGGQLRQFSQSAIATTRRSSRSASVQLRAQAMNAVRPSALAHLIDELAGQTVGVRNARVVGVFNPRVFLIESATHFPAMLGTRDRILVLVAGDAALRVAPAALVASSVVVVGVARTLLGMQVTAEVPWPAQLTREVIERLEIRAAILATSVQTAEGVDLTAPPASSPTAGVPLASRPPGAEVSETSSSKRTRPAPR